MDYRKIRKEAESKNISPQLVIKRKIGYRLSKKGELDCRFCEYLSIFNNQYQCKIIGESIVEYHAIVTKDHICTSFERGRVNDQKNIKEKK
jgi:hypothetical protein